MKLEIKIDVPGTLSKKIPHDVRDKIVYLKISGSVNSTDFYDVLDDMCTSNGEYDDYDNYQIDLEGSPALRRLDMGKAIFVGGEQLPYFGFHTQLEKLILPSGISSIIDEDHETGFSDSEMLTELILPEGIKTLRGVMNCPNLKELKIPQSVENIESFAFAGCSSIKNIRIPRNVKKIDGSSFADCHVSRYEVEPDNQNFVAKDGVIFSKDLTRLIAFPSYYPDKEYVIPQTTKVIGWGAFMNSQIKRIEIPNSVEIIEGWSFQDSAVSSLVIPDSVKVIGELAFRWCQNLKYIELSNNIAEIPSQLLSSCTSLKRIEIPSNVKQVDYSALAWCESLEEIIFHPGVEIIVDNGPILIRSSKLKRVTLPSSLRKLPGGAFSYSVNCNVFELDSQNPYFSLKDGVLYSKDGEQIISIPNRSRKRFDVPEGVSEISEMVFIDMKDLEEVTLPNSLRRIKTRAFQGCTSLRTITIPSSVQYIDIDALWADNLKDIYLSGEIPPIMTGKVKSEDWRFKNVRLHVPRNIINVYRNSPGWECFNIVANE